MRTISLAGIWVLAATMAANPAAKRARGAKMTEYLTGRSITSKAAVAEAEEIIVGRLLEAGAADAGAPGEAYYDHASAKIDRWLAGEPPRAKQPESIFFFYTVQTTPSEQRETAPAAGQIYIFFLKAEGNGTRAFKILPGDAPHIAGVQEALPRR